MFDKEFWGLVDKYEIPFLQLAQIVNCPIKHLIEWFDNGTVTEYALNKLKEHLGET